MKKFVSILIAFALVATTTGVVFAGKFQLSDIMEYKALPSYVEPDALKLAVAKGELPPIEQRLPKNPCVIKSKFMSDGLGVYGGVWRYFSACPTEGWNWAAGRIGGWFGIDRIIQESLVRVGYMWLLKNPNPVPNLATSWEWSKDGKTLTMHLIEGAKWSDGAPFTADDVLFTYYDCIVDSHIPSFQSAGVWTMDGKLTEIEKVGDYTIKWHFNTPFPVYILNYMGVIDFSIAPEHILAKHHPKYNLDATYESFIRCLPPEDLPPVVLGQFVPVKYEPERILLMRRNPYYWKVDETGKQLPYLNEAYWEKGKSGITRDLNLIGGTCDQTNLETPGIISFVLEQARKPGSYFRVGFGDYNTGFPLNVNFSLHKGVKTDRDLEMRKLFRDLKFRKALSYAIDRKGICMATMPGPYLAPHPGGFVDAFGYYDPDATVSYPYDPEKSKALLSEMGFRDTDGDGIVNWPENSKLAGENLTIVTIIPEDQTASVDVGEALVPLFRDIGVRLMLKVLKSVTLSAKVNAGEYESEITRDDSLVQIPDILLHALGPVTDTTPVWHQAGPNGERDLLPFEIRIRDLSTQLKTETSIAKIREMFSEIQHLWTENIYRIGTYKMRAGWGVSKRIKNIPENCPPKLYEYFETNCLPFQAWVPKEEQLPEQFPDLIPTYRKK